MDAFNDDVRRAAIDRIAVLFPNGRLVDTSANNLKVEPDDMEPEVNEGDYLGDLAEDRGGRSQRAGLSARGPVARRLRLLIKKSIHSV